MKRLLIAIIILLSVISLHAKLVSIEFKPHFALPLGNFDDLAQNGYGASIAPVIHVLGFADITAGVGYTQWTGEGNNSLRSMTYSMIPVTAGLRVYPLSIANIPAVPGEPYIYVTPGVYIFSTKTVSELFNTENTDKENLYGASAGMGYLIYPGDFGMSLNAGYTMIRGNSNYDCLDLSISIMFTVL